MSNGCQSFKILWPLSP